MINKINPLFQWINTQLPDAVIIGSSGDSDDRFSRLLKFHLGEKVSTPLKNLTDDEVLLCLSEAHITLCSLYNMGYEKLDCIGCSREKSGISQIIDHESENKMREKLRKLGYL
jgi:3'-phosphoadenosine 5'-phosphosulfate sulfotransferase (PAPS reductase)/FAD synthetase